MIIKQKRFESIFAITILLFSFLVGLGCASLPGADPSEEEVNAQALNAYNDMKGKAQRSSNVEWTNMVNRVANRIASASQENFQWEVLLIEDKTPNAWCMPGGKMAVYTGIMPVLKTEAALAAVMGHEVAHATRRHGLQRYARAVKENYFGLIIGATTIIGGQLFCKTKDCRLLTGLGGAAAGFAITFFDRKFSREDESEADRVGQIYMARAGYDPAESIRLWERMSAAAGGQAPPEFLSTHPSDARRRAQLTSWLPEAQRVYNQSPQQLGLGANIR